MYVCIYPFQQRQQGCFMESVLSRLGFKERMEADAECKQAYQQARAIRWAAEKIPHSNLPLYRQKKVWWQPQHKIVNPRNWIVEDWNKWHNQLGLLVPLFSHSLCGAFVLGCVAGRWWTCEKTSSKGKRSTRTLTQPGAKTCSCD